MNFKVELVNNNGYEWTSLEKDGIHIQVKGFLVFESKVLRDNTFAEFVAFVGNEKIAKICKKADGHFAIVINDENGVSIIADHMRSFPLFIVKGEEYLVTDTIGKDVIAVSEFDNIQKKVYENALFTLEEKTLFKNIQQVPAGVICKVSKNGVEYSNYWQFEYADKQIGDVNEAVSVISDGYDRLFKTCKELVGNKTVVIPLSGGYDSRLVLNGLLKNGVSKEKIITFTYGRTGYEDGVLSKQIADAVGVKHYFVDYCTTEAKSFFEKEYPKFSLYAGMTVSVPCVQEWYAVNQLKLQGVIDENCIFMPGYGGVLPGHYVRQFMLEENGNDKNKISEHIKNTLLLNGARPNENDVRELQEVFISSKYFKGSTDINYIEGYESLIYSEEQAKFILNAARDYELVGCQWITPFFFKEQYEVWGKIDNKLRWCNNAYFKCMETYFLPVLGEIPFTGSKVSKRANNGFTIAERIASKLQMIFNRSKTHYLMGMVPNKIFLSAFFANKLAVSINHLMGCEYLKLLRKIKKEK